MTRPPTPHERPTAVTPPARVDVGERAACADCAPASSVPAASGFARRILTLFGFLFGVILSVVVVGEWLGVFESFSDRIPWPLGLGLVLVGGYPVFRSVARATVRRRITSHTLMTLGVGAAVAVGEWGTAALVVLFMRTGDYAERFTTERARNAVRSLAALAPRLARVERDGQQREVLVEDVCSDEIVVVRPGEEIPVDGVVVEGEATVDQAAITGESMPLEAGPGAGVFAASFVRLGYLRVRATRVGADTTFGRVVRLVQEAEAHPAEVQRIADRFAAYYLPVVALIAALTFAISRDSLATAAVLVVACSCAFALATPIAVLASVGAAARRGVLIKGGKYLEALAGADVVLIDKTGTLTLGRPQLTDVIPLDGHSEEEILSLAAAAERFSEHPLGEAVRAAAEQRGVAAPHLEEFRAAPGLGVSGRVDGTRVFVGRPSADTGAPVTQNHLSGKTLLEVRLDDQRSGLLAAADTLRPEVPGAIQVLRALGVDRIELLTGDREEVASSLATALGVSYRAGLLPEHKLAVVREYQAQGHTVVMIGDGVNDAAALAAANVGVAMGAAGSAIAIEAAHVALMRDDWAEVPELLRLARRTLRIIKLNIAFTAVYNLAGLSLAAVGILPPVLAAAAQSLPDLGILANSSRLLRRTADPAPQRPPHHPRARAETGSTLLRCDCD